MAGKRIEPFKISTMDSLGQGVSRGSDKVLFVPKTAPGDTGEVEILAEKKRVAFGRVLRLSTSSPMRREPACPHFQDCPSCHYLHVDYEEELKFKIEALIKLFHKVPLPEVRAVPAIRRLGYRNRVQLHYDLKANSFGMLDARKGQIVSVPDCVIGRDQVQAEIRRLYNHEQWTREAPSFPKKGHVEIYEKDGTLKVSWNRPYAEGGFTQVFEEMNLKLKVELHAWLSEKSTGDLLDLFAGNGNLTNGLNYSGRLCVDHYLSNEGDFFSQDLHKEQALPRILKELQRRQLHPNTLVLDPPRAGLKGLSRWLSELRPRFVVYVSCDPHTLARDVSDLADYCIKEALLVDFFPSTFHFETMLLLERKS